MMRSFLYPFLIVVAFSQGAFASSKGKNIDLQVNEYVGCFLNELGEVYCWGNNKGGIGGFSVYSLAYVPNKIALPERAVQISAHNSAVCALLETREVYCWGENKNLKLGVGVRDAIISKPQKVPIPDDQSNPPVLVRTGNHHSCVLFVDQSIRCWGFAEEGNLGLFLPLTEWAYASIGGPEPKTNILKRAYRSVQSFYLGIHPQSNELEIEQRRYDELTEHLSEFDNVYFAQLYRGYAKGVDFDLGLGEIEDLFLGYRNSCLTTHSGKVYCWGEKRGALRLLGPVEQENYAFGTVDTEGKVKRIVPKPLDVGPFGVKKFVKSTTHACALLQRPGGLACWGDGEGLGTSDGFFPQMDRDLRNASNFQTVKFNEADVNVISDVAVGRSITCVTNPLQQVKCWSSRLNRISEIDRDSAQARFFDLTNDEAIKKIEIGANCICALTLEGKVYCTGPGNLTYSSLSNIGVPELITPLEDNREGRSVDEFLKSIEQKRVWFDGFDEVTLSVLSREGFGYHSAEKIQYSHSGHKGTLQLNMRPVFVPKTGETPAYFSLRFSYHQSYRGELEVRWYEKKVRLKGEKSSQIWSRWFRYHERDEKTAWTVAREL